MLVGAYPFQDPSDAKNFTKTIAVSDDNIIKFLVDEKEDCSTLNFVYQFAALIDHLVHANVKH